ncbi:MAG: HAMP domain-containing histidine kinase [Deltaproteobacteria bacterium]|nr:HAMP domain-containing histidine kinase [Deltaproteobacteria bacterium]
MQTKGKATPAAEIRNNDGQPRKRTRRIKIDILIHDLKGPLAVIEAGVVSLMTRPEKYGSITDKQERVLQRALRNIRITRTLVNDTLELGRAREGILNFSKFKISYWMGETLVEIFDLVDGQVSEKIRKCINLPSLKDILDQKNVVLRIDDLLWGQEVCLDLPKTTQILRNLLTNAIKYKKKLIEVNVSKTDSEFMISVKDDGEGIPSEFHEKIFQCYFQMDPTDSCVVRGHGLGLAGVMVLVEDMGGELLLDSDKGKGARFTVRLPVKPTN